MSTGSQWTERYAGALMNTFGPPQRVLARGEGASVWDVDGNRYLDLLGGIAVNVLGHAHPALVNAVSEQVATLAHVSNFFATPPQVELAEKLLELVGGSGAVFLANSGTEANEAALKLTRRTGRTKVVAATGSFHGRTMGALSLTSKEAYRIPFEPLPGDVTFVDYGDPDALESAVDDRTAAVVLEAVQGEAGVVVPPEGYLAAAREITSRHGALLWLDEVQAGMGRTGDWFAFAPSGVRPDVVTLAKGLGGGLPIGACIALGDAATLLQPGAHGTTFGGNPLASAAALAVLRTIENEGLLDRSRSVGQRLREGLVSHRLVTDVSGRGLLVGVGLAGDIAVQAQRAALAAGVIVNNTSPNRLRLAPPLVLSDSEADHAVAVLRETLDGLDVETEA